MQYILYTTRHSDSEKTNQMPFECNDLKDCTGL